MKAWIIDKWEVIKWRAAKLLGPDRTWEARQQAVTQEPAELPDTDHDEKKPRVSRGLLGNLNLRARRPGEKPGE
jgi:hypothetical protein